ncbi:MAG TPA: PfkB family carbohydrate kinase [Candidatus Limnocylindrales bacterium]|jgi:fructoselysine 6-kinase|nr:PfkB family carbohydrate kinase [Candidatus Limnocylindrales bacterium]
MKLAGVGDNVVDRYRDLGTMFPGGQALNVAVHARRFGIHAAYVGALGDDVAGRHVLEAIRAEGLDSERLRVVHGANASAEVALIEGNREFVGGDAGVSRIQLDPDDLAFLSGFDLIHSSESSYLEDQLPLLAGVAPLSYDFSVRRESAYLEPLLPYVQIAEFSLADLDEAAAEAWLERIHGLGPQLVLATRGSADALLYDGRRFWRQPSVPTELIDSLGAGDAFIARFLVGVLRDEPFDRSLASAATTASATCGSYGAFGYGTAAYPPIQPEGGASIASPVPAPGA